MSVFPSSRYSVPPLVITSARRVVVFVIILVFAGVGAEEARAALWLPAVLGEHMVLQSDVPAPFWGTCAPAARVRVRFVAAGGRAMADAETVADASGQWSVQLAALPAGLAGQIEVISGGEQKQLNDVVVGETWLCSGQSNMAYIVAYDTAPPEMVAAAQAEAKGAAGMIRFFVVRGLGADEPRNDVDGTWVVAAPENVGRCSAVAWNFAVALRSRLLRPIGLIVSAVGGSPVESWIARAALDRTHAAPDIWHRHEARLAGYTPAAMERHRAAEKQWLSEDPTVELRLRNARSRPQEPYSPTFAHVPVRLYNNRIHGLAPVALKGILWFQADGNFATPSEYPELIQTLITSWRKRWQTTLPFYYVELNNMRSRQVELRDERRGIQFVREAQNAALRLPATGVVTSIDLGVEDPHFPDKKTVGERLANLALNELYGQKAVVRSPQFLGWYLRDGKVRLRFEFADGLRVRGGGEPVGFVLRTGGEWTWAKVHLDGDEVVLDAPAICPPLALRYGWAENPVISLENRAGLPLRPFRTDTDPMLPYPTKP